MRTPFISKRDAKPCLSLQENYGFALVNSYSDGSSERTSAKDIRYYGYHNDTDTDPYIDICYKIVEIPRCENEDNDIVEVRVLPVNRFKPRYPSESSDLLF